MKNIKLFGKFVCIFTLVLSPSEILKGDRIPVPSDLLLKNKKAPSTFFENLPRFLLNLTRDELPVFWCYYGLPVPSNLPRSKSQGTLDKVKADAKRVRELKRSASQFLLMTTHESVPAETRGSFEEVFPEVPCDVLWTLNERLSADKIGKLIDYMRKPGPITEGSEAEKHISDFARSYPRIPLYLIRAIRYTDILLPPSMRGMGSERACIQALSGFFFGLNEKIFPFKRRPVMLEDLQERYMFPLDRRALWEKIKFYPEELPSLESVEDTEAFKKSPMIIGKFIGCFGERESKLENFPGFVFWEKHFFEGMKEKSSCRKIPLPELKDLKQTFWTVADEVSIECLCPAEGLCFLGVQGLKELKKFSQRDVFDFKENLKKNLRVLGNPVTKKFLDGFELITEAYGAGKVDGIVHSLEEAFLSIARESISKPERLGVRLNCLCFLASLFCRQLELLVPEVPQNVVGKRMLRKLNEAFLEQFMLEQDLYIKKGLLLLMEAEKMVKVYFGWLNRLYPRLFSADPFEPVDFPKSEEILGEALDGAAAASAVAAAGYESANSTEAADSDDDFSDSDEESEGDSEEGSDSGTYVTGSSDDDDDSDVDEDFSGSNSASDGASSEDTSNSSSDDDSVAVLRERLNWSLSRVMKESPYFPKAEK